MTGCRIRVLLVAFFFTGSCHAQSPAVIYEIGSLRRDPLDADIHVTGTRAVVGTREGIYEYSTLTGLQIASLPIDHHIFSIRYSPNGNYAAAASGTDNAVRIYALPGWTLVGQLPNVSGSLDWDATGTWLGVQGHQIYHVLDLQPLRFRMNGFQTSYTFRAFAGSKVIVGSGSAYVPYISQDYELTTSASWPYLGEFAADDHGYIGVGNMSGLSRIHYFESTPPVGNWTDVYTTFGGAGPEAFRFARNGRYVIHQQGGQPSVLRFWMHTQSNRTVTHLFSYNGNTQDARAFGTAWVPEHFDHAQARGVSATRDVHWLDVGAGTKIFDLTPHVGGHPGVTFSPDGKEMMTWVEGFSTPTYKGVKFWNPHHYGSGTPLSTIPVIDAVVSADFFPDGKRVAVGLKGMPGSASRVEIWSRAEGPWVLERTIEISCIRLDVSSKGLLAVYNQSGTTLVDGATGQVVGASSTSGYHGTPVFSPDGTKLLANGYVLSVPSLQPIQEFPAIHSGRVNVADWSADGKKIAYGLRDFHTANPLGLYVADLETGSVSNVGTGSEILSAVRFSPDGRTIAVQGTETRYAAIYDAATLQVLQTYNRAVHGGRGWLSAGTSSAIAYTSDGSKMAFSRFDGPITLAWNPYPSVAGRVDLGPKAPGMRRTAQFVLRRQDGSVMASWTRVLDAKGRFDLPLQTSYTFDTHRLEVTIPRQFYGRVDFVPEQSRSLVVTSKPPSK